MWTENLKVATQRPLLLPPNPPLRIKKERAERATASLHLCDLQLASLAFYSISASASLPIDYKGFLLSGDSLHDHQLLAVTICVSGCVCVRVSGLYCSHCSFKFSSEGCNGNIRNCIRTQNVSFSLLTTETVTRIDGPGSGGDNRRVTHHIRQLIAGEDAIVAASMGF